MIRQLLVLILLIGIGSAANIDMEAKEVLDNAQRVIEYNIRQPALTGTQNLLLYTEVDPNSHITLTDTRATASAIARNEDAYVYRDFGANAIDELNINFTINITEMGPAGDIMPFVGIGNTLQDIHNIASSDLTILGYLPAGTPYIQLWRGPGTAVDSYITAAINTPYYCYLARSAGSDTVNLYIYSDAAKTNLLDTLTVSGFGSITWQYIFAINSYNDGGEATASGYTENIKINNAITASKLINYQVCLGSVGATSKEQIKGVISDSGRLLKHHSTDKDNIEVEPPDLDIKTPQRLFVALGSPSGKDNSVTLTGTFANQTFVRRLGEIDIADARNALGLT